MKETHSLDPNLIPPMTDPLSRHWEQPAIKDIFVHDTRAVMSVSTLHQLHDYSRSEPTGVYEGKMWRCERRNGEWLLRWFAPSETPEHVTLRSRQILIVEENRESLITKANDGDLRARVALLRLIEGYEN